jgi:cytoskeleton protein RodZ
MPDGAELGALLRECREAKGSSLDDLARATRVPPRFIVALEEGRLRDLPAPVFVRGFLRSYCVAVAEPPDRALALYEAWVRANERPAPKLPATVLKAVPGSRSWLAWRSLAPHLLVAGILIVIGGAVYLLASSAATGPAQPSRPASGGGAPARPADQPMAPAVERPGTPPELAREAAHIPAHTLVARAHESTWVWVRPEDGAVQLEVLEPGTVREWRSPGRFTVTVGNAGGLSLELDGVALPPLGDRGQVVRDLLLPREPGP